MESAINVIERNLDLEYCGILEMIRNKHEINNLNNYETIYFKYKYTFRLYFSTSIISLKD